MSLIATGDNLRNKSLMGLQAMSREEAEREALYQQMVQQKQAQRSQLAGTGLGIGASYAVNNPTKVKDAATALGQKLGLLGGGQAAGSGMIAGGASGASAAAPVGTKVIGSVAPNMVGGGDAILSSGKLFLNSSPVAESAISQALNPLSAGAIGSPVGTTTTAAVGGGTAAVGGGTAAVGGGGTAVTGLGSATAGSAGTLATLGSIAAPLAIGVGAFYLLNKLFD